MAIALDASTPIRFDMTGDGAGLSTGTSATFTPAANSLLRVSVCVNSAAAATPTFSVPTHTPDPGVSAFTLVASNTNSGIGAVAIFEAWATSGGPITVSVSIDTTGGTLVGVEAAAWVDVWTGALSSQTGAATAVGVDTVQSISPTVTTTVAGSQVHGVAIDGAATGVPTSTDVIDGYDVAGVTSGGRAYVAANSAVIGAIALNFNAFGASPTWTYALAEILPAAATTSPISGTAAMLFGQPATLSGMAAVAGAAPLLFGQDAALLGITNEPVMRPVLLGALRPGRGPLNTGKFRVDRHTLSAVPPVVIGVLAGTATLLFGQGATVAAKGALGGAAALLLGQSGVLKGAAALNATAPLLFGQDAALKGAAALAGTAALLLGQTAAISGAAALSGASALVFSGSGTANAPAGALAGTAAMSFAAPATLGAKGALSATAPLQLAGSGALLGAAALAATAPLLLGQSATLSARGALSGAAALLFAGSAAALQQPSQISGAAALLFAGSGTVSALVPAALGGGGYSPGALIHDQRPNKARAKRDAQKRREDEELVAQLKALLHPPTITVVVDDNKKLASEPRLPFATVVEDVDDNKKLASEPRLQLAALAARRRRRRQQQIAFALSE